MLYEMLTGEAHPIRIPVEGVSRPISGIVDQALRSDPVKRFQLATQMTSALEAAVQATGLQDPLGQPIGRSFAPAAAQPVGPFPPRPRSAMLPRAAPSCALLIGIVAAAVIGMTVFATMKRSAVMRQEIAVRQADQELAQRTMQEEMERKFPEVYGDSDLDRPLIEPFPVGGKEPAWIAALRQAQRELANEEFERADANLRKVIAESGAGADCNEATNPYLQEAYFCAARAQAKLANPNLAFANLEQAIGLGFRDALRLQAEPDLATLKKDPRWKKIVDRLNR